MITVTEENEKCDCFACREKKADKKIVFGIGVIFHLCNKCLMEFHEATHQSLLYNWEDDLK